MNGRVAVLPSTVADQIAAGEDAFSLAWSDNRRRNAAGEYQADVRFARISAEPTITDLRVTAAQSAASVAQGHDVRFTVTASATGGVANEVRIIRGATISTELAPETLPSTPVPAASPAA